MSRRSFSFEERRVLMSWIIGAAALVLLCGIILALVVLGKTRRVPLFVPSSSSSFSATTTEAFVSRRLDGERVSPLEADLAPLAIMIDHHVDARPQRGIAQARLMIEAPVEGGMTRLLAFFVPTSSLTEIGPIRSARPYFIEWADAWKATYLHVGGSPEALERIRALNDSFHDVNEMLADGRAFWRSSSRLAPHSVMTNGALIQALLLRKEFVSSTMPVVWHFLEEATSTNIGPILRVSIPYGGSQNVVWKFDRSLGIYTRFVQGKPATDVDQSPLHATNVIVMKTEARVIDDQGRLFLRTTGSGEAIAYRDGDKFPLRWRRSPRESLRFETVDGIEFLLRPGKTWIQVTTDDRVFAGLE